MLPPGSLWPPDQKQWEYHNFQPSQTHTIAKVQQGNSLQDFIGNSQDYQYALIKYAIEHFRNARFGPITGYFQFMFMDPWPAISWSVVDYYREKKEGYRALQLASQPVLLHFAGLDKSGAGKPFFKELVIINDYHKAFKNASLRIWLEGPDQKELVSMVIPTDVLPDSRTVPFTPEAEWALPETAPVGNYRLNARLIGPTGVLISENKDVIIWQ